MADSKLASPHAGAVSPPPNCAICLGTCTNKCYSDSCMHEFCFKCLLEWSKIKAECPLCKQAFKSIIHNIKSINEYDEHVVENVSVEENRYLENASLIYLPPATPPALHQYHFRTTFTVDSHGEHAIQQMLLSHPLLTIGTFTPDRRRRGDTSATTFRRSVYNDNLWVYAPPDITGRYRDVSPSFFRSNPAARTRLVPWLNRELNALLYENTQQVMRLVDIIMDHLLRHHICSYMFRSLLSDYLGNKTDHFIHEFYNFMRSPFDMIGYDRHVIYTERRPSPIPYIDEIAVSDYDSDVILVSDTNNNQAGQGGDPVIIDLVDTDSDEPIIVTDNEDDLPLASFANRRKRSKHGKHKSHTITSSSKDRKHRHHPERSVESSNHSCDSNSRGEEAKKSDLGSGYSENSSFQGRESSRIKSEDRSNTDGSNSDDSFYSEHKPYVKSKIKDMRSEDKHKPGPSSGRLRNTLKKEASTNLWYSRPCPYESDSSDN
ncbi:E3 ubiquitin-protein ligase Topors-like [Asbolus verrucosus]|uniref:E3 ubiquitin-protein ligase Topors n=1 Tax=Asbolus verrucosus TaxID=1661398 RepID=A0A482VR50_ASBVE|nr:E3 ubiquitin-protein ligase Topors-like [Asbolus verrucosus]